MLVMAIVQTAVLPRFPIFGLIPQLPLLISLAWGLQRGLNEGVLWAFWAGICLDLFTSGPMGITSLAYMAAILSVTWISRVLPPNRILLPVVLSILATLISLFIYFLFLGVLTYSLNTQVIVRLLPVALLHAGLILPTYWLMNAIERVVRPRQVSF